MKLRFEFSKIILTSIISSYFVVLILGIFVVIRILINYPAYSVQALIALFSYVGGPVSIIVPFYLQKTKAENLHKYPDIQTIDDYTKMNSKDVGNGMGENLNN